MPRVAATCHGVTGAGDGPEAAGGDQRFHRPRAYTTFSQADWLAGWETAHADIGADWTQAQKADTLEYARTFSYNPPWVSPYRPGDGVITGTVRLGEAAPPTAGSNVFLDAYLGFDQVATLTATLGADNTFVFEKLAVDPNLTYLATVSVEGISCGAVVEPGGAARRGNHVNIYGVTDSPADIRINRAHYDHRFAAGRVGASPEFLLLGNDGDRTFCGADSRRRRCARDRRRADSGRCTGVDL